MAAVAGLKITTANYTKAIDTLRKRFGNKQQIISCHMDTLLELEPVMSPANILKPFDACMIKQNFKLEA